jgi:hypothetical protein
VVWNEKSYSRIRSTMLQLLESKSRTPETCRTFETIEIPQWKLGQISMDFIVGLPTTQSSYDSIWVIVDHFSKVTHFISVKTMYKGAKLAELYITKIVCLHRVPKKIVSDRGT